MPWAQGVQTMLATGLSNQTGVWVQCRWLILPTVTPSVLLLQGESLSFLEDHEAIQIQFLRLPP